MSIGHESHCSICRKGQNLAPCKFRDDFRLTISNKTLRHNDFIQFTHLRSTPGVNSDVMKMVVTALLIRIFIVYLLKYVSQTKSFIV